MLAARAPSVGLFVIALLAPASSACSGASAPEIPAAVTERSSAEPPPGEAEEDVTESTPSHAPPRESTAPPPDAGEPPPAPPPCAVEEEPNDSASRATPFMACIGGKLASSRDRDYLSVVAPPNAQKMTIEHEEAGGKVLYRVGRRDGDSVDFDESFTGEAPVMPVMPGATYVFRLTYAPGGSKAARPYELAVTFE